MVSIEKEISNFLHDTGITELEAKVGIRGGFFLSLIDEDDWSFIIKLHALFEAACNNLLLHHLKEPSLADIVARMELNNTSIGKVKILTELNLLSSDTKKLIQELSELRNKLVHKVENVDFSFNDMKQGITSEKLKAMVIAFSPKESLIRSLPKIKEKFPNFDLKEFNLKEAQLDYLHAKFLENPKGFIWSGSLHALTSILENYSYSDFLRLDKQEYD